jgi:hypothetical protein
MADHEKAIEYTKGDRRSREEVHRRNRFAVISKKGAPKFARFGIPRSSFHPARNRSLGENKTEHEEFPMDAGCSPSRILSNHPEDQFPNFLRRRSSSDLRPGLEISRQYKRKPTRCHRTTVSGVTRISDFFHSAQNRRTATQKSLSSQPVLGLGCRRLSTASCWRSARFSRRRLRRARKRRTSVPRDRTMNRNMARSYTRTVARRRQLCY